MSSHLKALAKRTNPESIALFPLRGTMLLPGCDLPLNVFEPRYLNMVDDALKGERLIGMVQPDDDKSLVGRTGGLGRIVQFAEAENGRYMVVLRGLKRFEIKEILDSKTPYKRAKISFDDFVGDIDIHDDKTPDAFSSSKNDRSVLTMAMKVFAKSLGVQVDWDGLADVPLNRLIDQASMISPFGPEDKQSLLEAPTHDDRRRLLIGLMHLYTNKAANGTDQPRQ